VLADTSDFFGALPAARGPPEGEPRAAGSARRSSRCHTPATWAVRTGLSLARASPARSPEGLRTSSTPRRPPAPELPKSLCSRTPPPPDFRGAPPRADSTPTAILSPHAGTVGCRGGRPRSSRRKAIRPSRGVPQSRGTSALTRSGVAPHAAAQRTGPGHARDRPGDAQTPKDLHITTAADPTRERAAPSSTEVESGSAVPVVTLPATIGTSAGRSGGAPGWSDDRRRSLRPSIAPAPANGRSRMLCWRVPSTRRKRHVGSSMGTSSSRGTDDGWQPTITSGSPPLSSRRLTSWFGWASPSPVWT